MAPIPEETMAPTPPVNPFHVIIDQSPSHGVPNWFIITCATFALLCLLCAVSTLDDKKKEQEKRASQSQSYQRAATTEPTEPATPSNQESLGFDKAEDQHKVRAEIMKSSLIHRILQYPIHERALVRQRVIEGLLKMDLKIDEEIYGVCADEWIHRDRKDGSNGKAWERLSKDVWAAFDYESKTDFAKIGGHSECEYTVHGRLNKCIESEDSYEEVGSNQEEGN